MTAPRSITAPIATFCAAFAMLVLAMAALPALAQDSPSPYTSGTRYDAAGRVTGTIAPSASGTTGPFIAARTTYDPAGRPIKVEEGSLSTWQGNSVAPASWGAAFTVSRRTEFTYDRLDRKLTEKTIGSDNVAVSLTQYSYDSFGRLECTAVRMNPASWGALPLSACVQTGTPPACTDDTAIVSANDDRITRNVYDNAGQLLKVQKAYGTCLQEDYASYTYSNNGKVTSMTDAKGFTAGMSYDGFDRQTRWNFPSPTTAGVVSATDYEEYGYDANGNRTSLRKRDGSVITLAYDNLNRVTQKTVPERAGLAATHTRDVFYSYNLMGLQTAARFDSVGGSEGLSAGYDALGRPTTSTITMDGVSRTLTSAFDAHSNRTQLTHPDGSFVSYSYDALARPTTILRAGSDTIASYTYDAAGRRTGFTGGISTTYGYDPAGRLNTLTNTLPAATHNNQWSFGFNPAGQIASTTRSNDLFAWSAHYNVNRNYTANGLNQYMAAGAAAFCYDANGNLTADGGSVYLYDVENRLVEKRAQGSGNTNCAALSYAGTLQAALRYDPSGRLYEVSGASGTTRMLYDGDALTAEYDATGTPLRRYVHGADGAADDPIAWYEGSAFTLANQRVMRSDWQGSVVLVTDAGGNTVLTVNRYDEYGIPQSSNSGRFQYTGQAWIAELGMYYYKARIYSPTLGRFLQTDPIGYEDQVNLYAYVGGDPVNRVDPSGLESPCVTLNRPCTDPNVSPSEAAERALLAGAVLVDLLNTPVSPSPDVTIVVVGSKKGPGFFQRAWNWFTGKGPRNGSSGGPGAGKRFPQESAEVKASKEGVPCTYCGNRTTNEPGKPNSRERDHINPKSKGGNNTPENEADACRNCNRQKSDKTPEEYEKWRMERLISSKYHFHFHLEANIPKKQFGHQVCAITFTA